MAITVSALKEQIEKAKENLKNVDESIKKITGRDPNEPRPGIDGRRVSAGGVGEQSTILGRRERAPQVRIRGEEPASKKPAPSQVFSRLGPAGGGRRVVITTARHGSSSQRKEKEEEEGAEEDDDDEDIVKHTVQSSVVSTAKKITKSELISAQNVGEKGKDRNRRMFGMLLGTLARFRTDSGGAGPQTKQAKRQKEIEERLEEQTAAERKQVASQRRTLFNERRSQQKRIQLLEQKVALADEVVEWEKEWDKKSKFILTKATPAIFFMPKDFTPRTQRALKDSQERIKNIVENHKKSVEETVNMLDEEIKNLDGKPEEDGKGENVASDSRVNGVNSGKKVTRVEEPEEEMDLDSMGPQLDIKVEMDENEGDHGDGSDEKVDNTTSQQLVEGDGANEGGGKAGTVVFDHSPLLDSVSTDQGDSAKEGQSMDPEQIVSGQDQVQLIGIKLDSGPDKQDVSMETDQEGVAEVTDEKTGDEAQYEPETGNNEESRPKLEPVDSQPETSTTNDSEDEIVPESCEQSLGDVPDSESGPKVSTEEPEKGFEEGQNGKESSSSSSDDENEAGNDNKTVEADPTVVEQASPNSPKKVQSEDAKEVDTKEASPDKKAVETQEVGQSRDEGSRQRQDKNSPEKHKTAVREAKSGKDRGGRASSNKQRDSRRKKSDDSSDGYSSSDRTKKTKLARKRSSPLQRKFRQRKKSESSSSDSDSDSSSEEEDRRRPQRKRSERSDDERKPSRSAGRRDSRRSSGYRKSRSRSRDRRSRSRSRDRRHARGHRRR